MTRMDFAREIKKEYEIPLNQSIDIVDKFTNTLYKLLAQGETIGFKGFGKFHVTITKPKVGRILTTNEEVNIPARKRVKFIPSNKLKEAVEKGEGI